MKWLLIILILALAIIRINNLERNLNDQTKREEKLEQQIKTQNKIFEEQIKEATAAGVQNKPGTFHSNSVGVPLTAIKNRIRELFGSHSAEAEAIIQCESGFNPNAYNPAGYYGLFQLALLHTVRFGSGFTSNPLDNISVAYSIWKEQGWQPWECKKVLT